MASAKRQEVAALIRLREYRAGSLVASLAPVPDGADDRTVVLILTINLEHALEDAICSRFKGDATVLRQRLLEGGSGFEPVISSFHAKAWLAHALGIIGQPILQDLMVFKEIRNTFAHSAAPIMFDTPPVADFCNFNILDKLDFSTRSDKPTTAKEKFMFSNRLLCGSLHSFSRPIEPMTPPAMLSEEVVQKMIESTLRILS